MSYRYHVPGHELVHLQSVSIFCQNQKGISNRREAWFTTFYSHTSNESFWTKNFHKNIFLWFQSMFTFQPIILLYCYFAMFYVYFLANQMVVLFPHYVLCLFSSQSYCRIVPTLCSMFIFQPIIMWYCSTLCSMFIFQPIILSYCSHTMF